MNVFKPALHRKIFIDRKIRERAYPNAASLARDYFAECGIKVNSRTIASDLAALRDEMGAPLHYDAEKRGYVYTNPAFTLDFPKIAPPELKDYLASGPDKPALETQHNDILAHKLRLKDPLSGKITVLAGESARDTEVWDLVQNAVAEARELTLEYRKTEYKTLETGLSLTFRPFHLLFIEENSFVLGAVPDAPAMPFALLNLSHIERAAPTGTDFSPPDGVSAEMNKNGDITVFFSENRVEVIVSFLRSPETADPEWTLHSRTELF
jgi:hypothetical protein